MLIKTYRANQIVRYLIGAGCIFLGVRQFYKAGSARKFYDIEHLVCDTTPDMHEKFLNVYFNSK